jgi:L-asparaginase/Glu-tRNA(Gln) amidotransferase subunit D
MEKVLVRKSQQPYILKEITEEEHRFYTSVKFINAGGTINMVGDKSRLPSDEVKSYLGLEEDIVFFDVFERPPDSSNIGQEDWDMLYSLIVEIENRMKVIDKKLKGVRFDQGHVVVAHGTDTMQITSNAIGYRLAVRKCSLRVIFTGAHSPLADPNSDGRKNLQKSIYLAKTRLESEDYLPPNIYCVIGDEIHLAARISKIYTEPNSDDRYFFSHPGPVGTISALKTGYNVKINISCLKELNCGRHLQLQEQDEIFGWGIVEHIPIDTLTTINVLQDLRNRFIYYETTGTTKKHRLGLIIQGNFVNNPEFKSFSEIFCDFDRLGIVTYVGSKEVYNRLISESTFTNLRLIPISLSHSRARLKLSWVLRYNIPNGAICNLLSSNIIGEIFDTEVLPVWTNFENYPNGSENVIIYPGINPQVIKDAVTRAERKGKTDRKIYLIGFGNGHLPTINLPLNVILSDFVKVHIGVEDALLSNNLQNDILGEMSKIILLHRENFIAYLTANYIVDSRIMLDRVEGQIWRKHRNKEVYIYAKKLTELFNGTGIRFDNDPCTIFSEHIELGFDKNIICNTLESHDKQYSWSKSDLGKITMLVTEFTDLVAMRIIKDALMQADEKLNILGNATDRHLQVHIKTSAVKSISDTSLYEIGNYLMIVGADSDRFKGWRVNYLMRKSNI